MTLTSRAVKGAGLTNDEIDGNFKHVAGIPTSVAQFNPPTANGGPKEIRLRNLPDCIADGDLQMHSSNRGGDRTDIIQQALDTPSNNLRLVVEGGYAYSQLKVKSGTTVFSDNPASGLVQLAGFNVPGIVNANRKVGLGDFDIADHDIQFIGGTYNGNGHNANGTQNRDSDGNEGFPAVFGFHGVSGLVFHDVNILNGRMYGVQITNAKYIDVRNMAIYHSPSIPAPATGATANTTFRNNHDGIHFNGPIFGVTVDGIRGYSVDDFFALTANDGEQNTQGANVGGQPVYTPYATYGPIKNVRVRNLYQEGGKYLIRLLSTTELIDDVHFVGVGGSCYGHFIIADRYSANLAFNRPGADTSGHFGNITFRSFNMELLGAGDDVASGALFNANFRRLVCDDWHTKGTGYGPMILTQPANNISEAYFNNLSSYENPGNPQAACNIGGVINKKYGDFFVTSTPPVSAGQLSLSHTSVKTKRTVTGTTNASALTIVVRMALPASVDSTKQYCFFAVETPDGSADQCLVFNGANYNVTLNPPGPIGVGESSYTNALTRAVDTGLIPLDGTTHTYSFIMHAGDASTLQIWKDGTLQTTETAQPPHASRAFSDTVAVGGLTLNDAINWPAEIAQFRLFTSALSDSDRQAVEAEVASAS